MKEQTLAILYDAYRELQSKTMFWVVLILNMVVIGIFALLGVNAHGLTLLWWDLGDMRRIGVEPSFIYKYAFSTFVVGFWLTWIATILALISTAGIFPDFLTSGSIDLYLAKPISRLRLFFTKYLAALLFVGLQVSLFTTLSFLVLGIRGGIWEVGLFGAIPIVLIFFSYLYAICVLLGTLTRSTIAALMLTLLAWFGFWVVDYIDRQVAALPVMVQIQHDMMDQQVKTMDRQIAARQPTADPDEIARLTARRDDMVRQRDSMQVPPALTTVQQVLFGIKSVVPKTRDTIVLLDRVLFQDKDLQQMSKQGDDPVNPETEPATASDPEFRRGGRGPNFAMQTAQIQIDRRHSAWWVIGTSLIFEAVCLALAAWRFCTRDY